MDKTLTEYQKYQLEWMIAHGYSLDDLIDELTDYQREVSEDGDNADMSIREIYDEWQQNIGFSSEIWACEDEWEDCESSDDED